MSLLLILMVKSKVFQRYRLYLGFWNRIQFLIIFKFHKFPNTLFMFHFEYVIHNLIMVSFFFFLSPYLTRIGKVINIAYTEDCDQLLTIRF